MMGRKTLHEPETKQTERRQYRRYIVRGKAKCVVDMLDVWGDLVNIGCSGILIRTSFELPKGVPLTFRLFLYSYSESVKVRGQVVGGDGSTAAIQFVERNAGLD